MRTTEKKQYASGVECDFGYDHQLVIDSMKKNYPRICTMIRNTMEEGFVTFIPIFSDTAIEKKYNLSDCTFEILVSKSVVGGVKRWQVYYQRKFKSSAVFA
jgi:hypothetical protein